MSAEDRSQNQIGELPLSLQIKLLRALQEEEITPLGSTGIKKLDVRVIAATAKDFGEEIKKRVTLRKIFTIE